jgi:hypothetical protein
MIPSQPISRGAFFTRVAGLSAMVMLDRFGFAAVPSEPLKHPEPRAGITAAKVLSVEDLGAKARKAVTEAYDAARQYPAVFDGLACACGCHGDAEYQHRSLLSCYESRQPTGCQSCQMEAAFVGGLAKDGKPLAEIRGAVDKKFGN